MKPHVDISGLTEAKPWEYAVRFAFGGAVALLASLTSSALGDFAGGLALAFPAILPAALTLVKRHDGRKQATDDARGARLGAVALTAFATVVYLLAMRGSPAMTLSMAMLAWILVASGGWWLVYGRR